VSIETDHHHFSAIACLKPIEIHMSKCSIPGNIVACSPSEAGVDRRPLASSHAARESHFWAARIESGESHENGCLAVKSMIEVSVSATNQPAKQPS
jgi:hypothetical protein